MPGKHKKPSVRHSKPNPNSELKALGLNEYQRYARLTDQNSRPGVEGLHMPVLGLFGEIGGLLSELKKKQRDKDSYVAYTESVLEEFGDVLWYFANIAGRAGLDLSILAQRMSRVIGDWDQVKPHKFGTFSDIQSKREHVGPVSNAVFEHGVINLAAKSGILLQHISAGAIEQNRDVLSADLVEIFRAIVQAAEDADISLEDAAVANLKKISSRWPHKRTYPAFYDANFPGEEQLPRKLTVIMEEKQIGERLFVLQHANGINIGDRLTDNIAEPDDYRFHDVFHWTYAAVLGWSPVTRALLRLKRKSNSFVDENQDGARAQLIEEGVATWIFKYAQRLNFYENIGTVDYHLLKSIRQFVQGYEVETCPLWLWEQAILDGCRIFRFLKRRRRGALHLDLTVRKVHVTRLS
jgi:NTP pyrophosphatase (non-canonical NTP hydrolase)